MFPSVRLFVLSYVVLSSTPLAYGRCYDPSPAFPPPKLGKDLSLSKVFENITQNLIEIVSDPIYNSSSFSIEVTSSKETLWELHHTALVRNDTRRGVEAVTGDSVYRIASISKVFTVLGILQQHEAGTINLDDTVDKYIAELQGQEAGRIPWNRITLRSLANQLSGLPRDFCQSDMINELDDPTQKGFPPMSKEELPVKCDEYTDYMTPCTAADLLSSLRGMHPLFAPNLKSTYSNLNYVLLGLVLEAVTGKDFGSYLEMTMLKPLNMSSTSVSKPDDSIAVLPSNNYWDVNAGVQNYTEGLFSSSSDLSKLLRYILTHHNDVTTSVNWLQPSSFASNMNSFYGMPWETFRTDKILSHTSRPVTFMTKSGSLPGYYSNVIVVPEYDLGITILIGGKYDLLSKSREAVTVPLIQAVEAIAQADLAKRYTGRFASSNLNSSVTLAHTMSKGLHITSLISNGTDILKEWSSSYLGGDGDDLEHLQVIPTLLHIDEEKHGEIWWMIVVPKQHKNDVWDDFCITDDYGITYGANAIPEMIFWMGKDGEISEVEFTVLRARMAKEDSEAGTNGRHLNQVVIDL